MAAKLPDLLMTTEATLAGRPAREPQLARENAALLAVADECAERPGNALQTVCRYALDLCGAGSAGISLFATSASDSDLYWPAIAGAWSRYVGGGMPRRGSPSGVVADRDAVLLFSDTQVRFPACAGKSPEVHEMLIAPLHHAGRIVGTVWVLTHDAARDFDQEDRRALTNLARCAASAYAARRGDELAREVSDRLALATSSRQVAGLWDWDVPRDLVTSDARFAELYGVPPERARVGASIAEFFKSIHPDDLPAVAESIRQALATGDWFSEEYRLVQPGGDVRWVVAEGQATMGPNGQPVRFPGISFDITARRETEERLRRMNSELEDQLAETKAKLGGRSKR